MALGAWCGAGCAGEPDAAQLLVVTGLSPGQIEAGAELKVAGDGFPSGHPCELRLVGETHRPGLDPIQVSVALAGRAVAPDRVSAVLDEEAFSALGGRGTFVGQVGVSFAARDRAMRVGGRADDQVLDLVQPFERNMATDRALRERALSMATFLGVVVDEGAETQEGVRVDWAAPGSRAERAGLVHADVIAEAGGVRVHSLADLAPAAGLGHLALRVKRPGQGTPVDIRLSLSGFESPALDETLRPLCAAAVLLLLVGVWLGPLRGPTPFLARCLSRYRAGMPFLSVRVWDDLPAGQGTPEPGNWLSRARRHLSELSVSVLVTAALLAIALSEPAFGLRFNTLPVYLGLSALRLGMATLVMAPDLDGPARRTRATRQLGRMGVLAVTIAIACAQGGTRSLEGIVSMQGGWPWRWGLFENPALMLIFPAFVVQGSRPCPTRLGSAIWARGVAYALDVGARLLICGIGAAVFFGGWEVGGFGLSGSLAPFLLGAALFALKAWAVALLLHAGKLLDLGAASPRWFTPALCVSALCAAVLWVGLGVREQVVLALGAVAFTSSALLVVVSLVRLARSPHPMSPRLS